MRISVRILQRAAALALCVCAFQSADAQQPAAAPKTQDKTAPRKSTPEASEKPPSAAADNPFPEDESRKAAGQSGAEPQNENSGSGVIGQQPAPAAGPDSAGQNPAAPAPASTAEDNPFPEDVSRKAAESAAPSSSGVSSSSSGSPDPDIDNEPDRHRLPKPSKNVESGSLSAMARAKQDVQVGTYYLGSENWKGAYARFVEAAHDDPTSADAVYGVAEAARHLGHQDEAVANYQLYLDMSPDGSRAKLARKALDTLAAKK